MRSGRHSQVARDLCPLSPKRQKAGEAAARVDARVDARAAAGSAAGAGAKAATSADTVAEAGRRCLKIEI